MVKMTKSNEINILRADHVVGLSQASIEISNIKMLKNFPEMLLNKYRFFNVCEQQPLRNKKYERGVCENFDFWHISKLVEPP